MDRNGFRQPDFLIAGSLGARGRGVVEVIL